MLAYSLAFTELEADEVFDLEQNPRMYLQNVPYVYLNSIYWKHRVAKAV